MLAGYVDGQLTQAEEAEVVEHMLSCDLCMETLAVSKTMLSEMDLTAYDTPAAREVVSAVIDRVKKKIDSFYGWVAELTPPAWFLGFAPSAVRSSVSAEPTRAAVLVTRRMGPLQAEMYVQKSRMDAAFMAVKVTTGRKNARNVCLTLAREGGGLQARYVTRDYEVFENLGFGEYHLIVEQNADEKGTYTFHIDEEGFHEN
jgi:anti-sigma factor RsiW